VVRILIVRSVSDVTARARIRDAALTRFGADGVAGTTVRAIADDVGVSPALVLHHFGSKDGLRQACDDYIAGLAEMKLALVEEPAGPVLFGSLAQLLREAEPVRRYLARTILDGTAAGARLFDRFVAQTDIFLEQGQARGEIRVGADRRALAALLVGHALSTQLLGDHLARALGAAGLDRDPQLRVSRVAVDIYTYGVFTDDRWVAVIDDLARQPP
jgi:AcrR family transcriptional regulator